MAKYSKQEIFDFQKLYLRYYGKNLTLEETEKRFDALVRLLRLVRDAFSVEILTELYYQTLTGLKNSVRSTRNLKFDLTLEEKPDTFVSGFFN